MTRPMDEIEPRVERATRALRSFSDQLVGELTDTGSGGFTWWPEHSDWKTLTLIADYLIQSVDGTADALRAAATAASEHHKATTVRANDIKLALASLRGHPRSSAAVGQAMYGRIDQRRKDKRIEDAAEHSLYHLAQTLDRMATVLVIVGGFHVADAERSDWGTLEALVRELDADPRPKKPRVEPLGSRGCELQNALVSPLRDVNAYGPPDWLPWLRETRNAMTHRAPTTKWGLHLKDGSIVHPMFQQPKWSTVQTLVYSDQPGIEGALLREDSVTTIYGLLDSTHDLVRALLEAATICWTARRADSDAIVQHGRQWRTTDPSDSKLSFQGYGDGKEFKLPRGTAIHVHDTLGARLRAAKVMGADRAAWFT